VASIVMLSSASAEEAIVAEPLPPKPIARSGFAGPRSTAEGGAKSIDVSLSANIGFGAPGGLGSLMARVDFYRQVFVEADVGYGTAGREIGGGIGITLREERSKTAKLGWAHARLTGSALITRSRTTEREAGIEGLPWELVQGAGTYWWGYVMLGGDIKLDSHVYILAEVGVSLRLAREATYPMDPAPDDMQGYTTRAGFGVTF
jgi:hypothetical protein